MNYLLVFIGAGLGGALRYYISSLSYKIFSFYFPSGTLLVNIIGSFILGLLIFGFDEKSLLSGNLKLLLAIGFCGGLTTFSTFSFETINLLKNAEFFLATTNILVNLILTLGAIYLSYLITR